MANMTDRPPDFPGQMPSSFDDEKLYNERPMQKVTRKLREEPLVPLGIGLTVFAFANAYRALRRGDSRQANRMFRARVAAQAFTVIAMVAGSMYYNKDREKTKELRKLKEEREAEVKHQRWIRELEIRDEEEKAFKASIQRRAAVYAAAAGTSDPTDEKTEGTGGVLTRMGLWSRGEKAAAEEAKIEQSAEPSEPAEPSESAEPAADKRSRKENPNSSLGALGEVFSSKK